MRTMGCTLELFLPTLNLCYTSSAGEKKIPQTLTVLSALARENMGYLVVLLPSFYNAYKCITK